MAGLPQTVLLLYVSTVSTLMAASATQVTQAELEQKAILNAEEQKCLAKLATTKSNLTGVYCNGTWDDVMCWNDTLAGVVAKQRCVSYVIGFDNNEYATKTCLPNGTWYMSQTGSPWTNMTACQKISTTAIDPLWQEHLPRMKLMSTIGYSVSLPFLIVAVAIMVYFKRLRCPRNMIHLNLFLVILFKAFLLILKDGLLVKNLGFAKDLNITSQGVTFVDGLHWECRLIFTTFNYIVLATVVWIFIEGLYLHLILTVAVFGEKQKMRWFLLLGWGLPLLVIIPWIMVRIFVDSTPCWNMYHQKHFLWIIQAPMVILLVTNFLFFVNIVRLLFTKISASRGQESRFFRYRQLVKSTLILIPLFGVNYMLFIFVREEFSVTVSIVKLYLDLGFNAFQGFIVTMLFCFLNSEVQTELKRKWKRILLRRSSSTPSRSFNTFHSRSINHVDTNKQRTRAVFKTNVHINAHATPNGQLSHLTEENTPLSPDNLEKVEENGPLRTSFTVTTEQNSPQT